MKANLDRARFWVAWGLLVVWAMLVMRAAFPGIQWGGACPVSPSGPNIFCPTWTFWAFVVLILSLWVLALMVAPRSRRRGVALMVGFALGLDIVAWALVASLRPRDWFVWSVISVDAFRVTAIVLGGFLMAVCAAFLVGEAARIRRTERGPQALPPPSGSAD